MNARPFETVALSQLLPTALHASTTGARHVDGTQPPKPARQLGPVTGSGTGTGALAPIKPTMVVVGPPAVTDQPADDGGDGPPSSPDDASWPPSAAAGRERTRPALPRRVPARASNVRAIPAATLGRPGPDYATLKRIRAALKTAI